MEGATSSADDEIVVDFLCMLPKKRERINNNYQRPFVPSPRTSSQGAQSSCPGPGRDLPTLPEVHDALPRAKSRNLDLTYWSIFTNHQLRTFVSEGHYYY